MAINPQGKKDDFDFLFHSSREYLEPEFVDGIRFVSLVIIDIVPQNRRRELMDGLEKILQKGNATKNEIAKIMNSMPNIKEAGLTAQHGPFLRFFNSKRPHHPLGRAEPEPYRFLYGPVCLELPDPFRTLEIAVGQLNDFAYYLMYSFILEEAYGEIDKETYVASDDMVPALFPEADGSEGRGSKPRGPDHEPKMGEYEEAARDFLRPYVQGLFINEERQDQLPPSVRVISVPEIPFQRVGDWIEERYRFFDYLRVQPFFTRFRDTFMMYQQEGIFRNSPYPKGVTILYSVKDGKYENEHITWQIAQNAEFISGDLIHFIFPYLWCVYTQTQIENQWMPKVESIQKEITASTDASSEAVKARMKTLLDLYARFTTFANFEKINIRKLLDTFEKFGRRTLARTHEYKHKYESDIFKGYEAGVAIHSKQELTMIEDVQNQINTLLGYYRELSNIELNYSSIKLQRSIRLLTVVIGIATGVISLVAILVGT